ncbi:YeeE/YedE family protein [Lutimaribacter sp. EGI FJ00015]|uniref:YeeE/YedE family protein n=1 Tax=Lutimaribacter degradans TaxID=2945989 RepID=A0ACC5ZWC0_9RHOB|nr:YeeE/YedE family protein [Lutimaribacter sp. EGI FJ00013]MCM2562362.1 YeeE/YedE family protein [Lutimaribacter sp. EGI FJ00013]MCO0613519.1 YeeE/YedE family protein [Lutimaribacter sp. EGI FJ00015]MCO0636491.1 YeeE/YedE family protein [Lutimaribacter sp. EGI FJ00014]
MLEWISDEALVALVGLGGGILLGLAARLGRFCTMGAIEDMLYGGSDLRMRMWILAIGVAILGTFGLAAIGVLELETSYYLSIRWMPVAAVLGGLMFGYGMALAGNCGFGSIARAGGGDFRAFVIVVIMGVSAYLVLSGPLATLRVWAFPQADVVNDMPPGLAHLLHEWTGISVSAIGLAIGAVVTIGALSSRSILASPQSIFWAAIVGIAVVSGWAGSYWVASNGFTPMPVVSHSFSAPVGETLLFAMTGSARAPSFAVGSVTGVAVGAFIGSLIKGHFRWEACEDPRELRRQIIGAALMGAGAVLALGCTIGQGLSAFSMLAFSAPLVFASIIAGAALGLRQLIEGFQPAE